MQSATNAVRALLDRARLILGLLRVDDEFAALLAAGNQTAYFLHGFSPTPRST
jgi:hypothetical protein